MIQVIAGKKGSGKTKRIIDMANVASRDSKHDIVFIDDDARYMYDLRHEVRFINAGEYGRVIYDAYLRRRHFGSLDGLRALCIGAVLWHHSPLMDPASPVQLLTRGFTGVDMFFVLSGFLITTLLLREEQATGRISLSAFYWRRALRILPGYLLLAGQLTG